MKISAYFAARVFKSALFSEILLIVIYVSVDFVEVMSAFSGNISSLAWIYPLRIPLIIGFTLPLGLTLGLQLTLAAASRDGEMDALASAGISKWRIAVGLLAVPFFSVFLSGPNQMVLCPVALRTFGENLGGTTGSIGNAPGWRKSGDTLVFDGSNLDDGIEIEREKGGAGRAFRRFRTGSESLEWTGSSGWRVSDRKKPKTPILKSPVGTYYAAPTLIIGAPLTASEIFDAIDHARAVGWSPAPFEAEFGLRIALILSCFVVPLLSLGLRRVGRDGSVTSHVAVGVAAAATYWLFLAVAWNGAVVESFSPLWIYAVPLGVFVLAGGLFTIR